jgi:hypothetical protein
LTGTVLEFLEGMMAARRNNSGFAVYVKGEELLLRSRDAPDRPFGRREHYGTLKDANGFVPSFDRQRYDEQLRSFARLYDRAGELSKPWVHFSTKEELSLIWATTEYTRVRQFTPQDKT